MKKCLWFSLAAGILSLLLLNSCASTENFRNAEAFYHQGNYAKAAGCFPASTAKATSAGVQTNLYLGSIHLMSQNYAAAHEDFSRAQKGMKKQDENANYGSAYLARTYDSIMSDTYQAWTLLFQNQPDKARVALNRLELTMGKATERNRKAIEKRNKEIAKQKKENPDQVQAVNATMYRFRSDSAFQKYQRDLETWGAYGDFENPASRLLCGIFRLYFATDASDLEKAVYHLRRTCAMTQNASAQTLLDIAEQRANGQATLDDLVIVLFENGLGPTKEEQRFDLFIPLRKPIHAGIAIPKLVHRFPAYSTLLVGDGSSQIGQTLPFCDFDRIVAAEFKSELPGIIAAEITKTVIKVILQVIATEIAEREGGVWAGLAVGIAGSAISYATTRADIRNWNLLPKEYQLCILRRPASGKLTLTPGNSGMAPVEITLPNSGPVLIYSKAAVTGHPIITSLIHSPSGKTGN